MVQALVSLFMNGMVFMFFPVFQLLELF